MTDYPRVSILLERRIAAMKAAKWPWQRKHVALLDQVNDVMEQLACERGAAMRELWQEQERSAALERELHAEGATFCFDRTGFDLLGGARDDCAVVKDLLKALDLIGEGIGGEVGFAISAVAEQAAMAAGNAFDAAESMLAMRGKGGQS